MDDPNPDRRNLNLLSLAIIVYFIAGGRIQDDAIRLQIVNISLERPWAFFVVIWLLYFWFLIRFWQQSRGAILLSLLNSWRAYCESGGFKKSLKQYELSEGISTRDRFHIESTAIRKGIFEVEYDFDDQQGQKLANNRSFRLFSGRVIKFLFWFLYHEKSFGNCIAPYLLFFLVLLIALIDVSKYLNLNQLF